MNERSRVTIASFTSASRALQATGLLGWLGIEVGGLLLVDGVALRRTKSEDGRTSSDCRLVLSFPEPESRGKRRRVVCPLNDHARREIEAQVLAALAASGGIEEEAS